MRTLWLAAVFAALCAPLVASCASADSADKPAAHSQRGHSKARQKPSSIPAHVQTAEYLWLPAEASADPRTFTPYLTYAYPTNNNYGTVRAAGIKTVLYINPLMPHVPRYPDFDALTGQYATAQAKDCSGNLVRTYHGTGYLLDVEHGDAKQAVRAALDGYAARTKRGRYANGPPPVDIVFVDNANTFYGVSPMPCGYDAARWTAAMDDALSAIPYPTVINTLLAKVPNVPERVAGLRGKNIAGGMFEGCYYNKYWESAETAQIQTLQLLRRLHKPPGPGFWCYLNGTTSDASTVTPLRMFAYASFLLTYDPAYSVFQESFNTTPSTFRVMPETQFVPLVPDMNPSTLDDLKSGGAYVRLYHYCYYRRKLVGACEVVVNPDAGTTAAVPNLGGFRHSVVLQGGGIMDGGQVLFNAPAPSSLDGKSGAILVP